MSTTNEHHAQNQEPTTEPIGTTRSSHDKERKGFPMWAKVTAGAGALATAVTIGYVANSGGSKEVPINSRPVATGEANPGQSHELAPLDIFNMDITHEDYGRQLDVTLPYLEERRAKSLEEISNELNAQNRVNLSDPNQFPEGSVERQAQIDQNNSSADLWTISGETNTILAHNLLNSVFKDNPDLSEDAYDLNEKLIGNGKGRILGYAGVNEASPVVTTGTLGTTKITGAKSYMALVSSWTQPKSYEEVVVEYTSLNGKHHNNVVVESIQWGGNGFVEHPAQIAPTPKS